VDIISDLGVEVVFSALPSDVAKDIEKNLAEKGIKVFSNASSYRMENDVPILIPEVNYSHIDMVKNQNTRGFIVTNANCAATGLALTLKPILDKFGVEEVVVSTYQAVSGAGFPGIPSMEIMGNVIPYIPNEEKKIEIETKKILGEFDGNSVKNASFGISSTAVRVPVINGHTEVVYVKPDTMPLLEDIISSWVEYRPLKDFNLPTAPEQPIHFLNSSDRPQPRIDVRSGEGRSRGMVVSVGRCSVKNERWIRYVLLSHNTIRGAAGGSILNAEQALEMGYL